MKWTVMVTAPYMQPVIERFRPLFAEHQIELLVPPVEERFEEADLLQWVDQIDGVICGDDRFTERVLQAAPRLKVISKWGTGTDSIDKAACQRLGIAVRNTPNAFSEPVADSVLGYMLCFARRLPWMTQAMRQGIWHKIPGIALRECTLGVIGVGDVGKAVVRRARAFGMRLLGNDLVAMPEDFLTETGITMVTLEELLQQADFISINCDLNPTSQHLINETTLALVKPTAVMINTARGPVIDEPALIRALQEQRIAGAALDVFEDEPLPPDSPLRQLEQVMLAPHNANSSPQAWEHVHQNTIRNVLEVLEQSV
ncbi:MAG: phosphoglycerate dehydrogenase [Chloroflexaceae bacterium]|nr:phosphoglycerate dehydrogenase [Chloroflexaceae bacterium]